MAFGTTGTYYWISRLALGTSGQVITMSGGEPVWSTPFSDPMTTRGDVMIRNAANATARLAIGTAAQVLTSDGTDIAWGTVAGSGDRVGFAAKTSTTSVSANTWTNVTFSTEIEDTDSDWDGTAYTVPETGMYEVNGAFVFSSVTDGNRFIIGFSVNNSGDKYILNRGTSGGTNLCGGGGAVKVSVTAGDVIRMNVFCANATSGSSSVNYNTFSIYKMR